MQYDMKRSRIPVVSEETMRKIMEPPKKKYDPKKALREAKKDLRKQGFFVI